MNKLVVIFFCLFFVQCQSQTKKPEKPETSAEKKIRQDAIIQEHVYDCADKIGYTMMMKEYQDCLDAGLKKDSTIAYLWQQKAMPYYKVRKYSVGKVYLDKAVEYDEKRWLPYRGFMKCIFSKDYKGAIEDFDKCITKYGNSYEMDHTYAFYIGLSYLMINEFEKATNVFKKDIEAQIADRNEAHFIDWFYYGISFYEQQKWEEALNCFNQTLEVYHDLAEAQYFKAVCLARLGRSESEINLFFDSAIANGKKGNTINEDNAVYEKYPYQLSWKN